MVADGQNLIGSGFIGFKSAFGSVFGSQNVLYANEYVRKQLLFLQRLRFHLHRPGLPQTLRGICCARHS